MATVRITKDIPVHDAIGMLLKHQTPNITVYESILDDILKTGHPINSNESELLMSALRYDALDEVKLLLARGARVSSNIRVFNHPVFSHAYSGGRVYSREVADILLEHTMSSPHFELIKGVLLSSEYDNRIDVFNTASDETLRAKLYIRIGKLPKDLQNANIMNVFTKAVNDQRDITEKLRETEDRLAETEKCLAETEKRLAETQAKLSETQDQLIISKDNATIYKGNLTSSLTKLAETEKRLAENERLHESVKGLLGATQRDQAQAWRQEAESSRKLKDTEDRLAKANAMISKLTAV